jgi:hypothetical protein
MLKKVKPVGQTDCAVKAYNMHFLHLFVYVPYFVVRLYIPMFLLILERALLC